MNLHIGRINLIEGENSDHFVISFEIALTLLAAALLVHPYDTRISDYLRQYDFYKTALGRTLKPLGKFDFVFLAIFFVTWVTGNRRLLYRFSWAAIPSGIFVLLVKIVVRRPRPTGDHLSFPSGDTSIAFVWATILAAEYPALGVPAYLLASFIAVMRVTGAKHYPADVLAGAAIGFTAASLAVVFLQHYIPRKFFRATRRLGWGMVFPNAFILYVVGTVVALGIDHKPICPILAISGAVIVCWATPILIKRMKAHARLTRFCRRKKSLTQPQKSTCNTLPRDCGNE